MKRYEIIGCLIVLFVFNAGVLPLLLADEAQTSDGRAPRAQVLLPAFAPKVLRAKVLVVNRAEYTVTVESEGNLHLFRATPKTPIFKNKRLVNIAELVSGQEAQLVLSTGSQGTPELGIIYIQGSSKPAQAMGDEPITIVGKVIVVNAAESTVMININGQNYLFEVRPTTQILDGGKAVKLASIVPGQEVQLVLSSGLEGILELRIIYLGPIQATEASRPAQDLSQVDPSSKSNETNRPPPSSGRLPPPSRFQTPPNPANIGGQVVSPN